jgi:hypothetical protein
VTSKSVLKNKKIISFSNAPRELSFATGEDRAAELSAHNKIKLLCVFPFHQARSNQCADRHTFAAAQRKTRPKLKFGRVLSGVNTAPCSRAPRANAITDFATPYREVFAGASQLRLRVIQKKRMKTTINPAAIGIQFCPSKPKKEKRSIRNCTASVPIFCAN